MNSYGGYPPLLLLDTRGFALLLKLYFSLPFKALALSLTQVLTLRLCLLSYISWPIQLCDRFQPIPISHQAIIIIQASIPRELKTLSNATSWKSDQLLFHLLIWWNKAFHYYVCNFVNDLTGQAFYSALLIQYMLNKINRSILEYFIPQENQPTTFS